MRRFPDAQEARIGVLMADPYASTSEPPLAIVAEFRSEINALSLRELHRLSWNFSHAPTVITIEPTMLRVWSCCEAPDPDRPFNKYLVQSVLPGHLEIAQSDNAIARATRALHWMNLVSGRFFADHSPRFDRDGRADQMLLGNLRYIRDRLATRGLDDDDICHDLLARVIFVQFLLDRTDHDGNPALTVRKLHCLQAQGVLKNIHSSFDSILLDYEDTYRLFDWLNGIFNGDLFPGQGSSPEQRATGWRREKEVVKGAHLALLAEFIRGDLDMSTRQACLWPQYSFDVIPLDFISSIYETFVADRASHDGIYYTPPYLVDFVLDRILPWDGTTWDLTVIDPACGSGIFLVKAFQRLVHRWKLCHGMESVSVETLQRLLERNIFGVDRDPHAVRVACFSLYLAMCDEIEPRHYWTRVTFPAMRGYRLVCSDFFCEDHMGFRTVPGAGSYDVVVGNAPFGANTVTDEAKLWAMSESRQWSIPNKDIGGLFLAKGAQMATNDGRVALIQSANALLFNIGNASVFRRELFARHRVEEIYNLSALRHRVFEGKRHTRKKPVAPVCIFVLRRNAPKRDDRITYISPKRLRPSVDEFAIMIEPDDRCSLTVQEAIDEPSIWAILMWGNARDVQLIRRLRNFPNMEKLKAEYVVESQRGIVFGDRIRPAPYFDGRRLLNEPSFPEGSVVSFDPDEWPLAENVRVHSRDSRSVEAFSWPQLVVKLSWDSHTGRFHARINASKERGGVLCNQSYVSIHAESSVLEAACVSHNSKVAVYFHFLTSGRFAAYRPALSKSNVMGLPVPVPRPGLLGGVESYRGYDDRAFECFGLKDAERVLIEDAIEYKLRDFLAGSTSRRKAFRSSGDTTASDADLRRYCNYFLRVLKAGFGGGSSASATVFQCPNECIPYRLVAFGLGGDRNGDIEFRSVSVRDLLREFERLDQSAISGSGGIYYQRIARIYDVIDGVPTVCLIKPDQRRFWTRSKGLVDGDEVALDLYMWHQRVAVESGVALQ